MNSSGKICKESIRTPITVEALLFLRFGVGIRDGRHPFPMLMTQPGAQERNASQAGASACDACAGAEK